MFHRLMLFVGALFSVQSWAYSTEPVRPLVVAHRGLLHHAPENTLANFRACLELQLGFEFDVERTQDGHLICIHDDTVDRTTSGSGKVAQLTLHQIRQLDAGSWFDAKFAGQRVPTVEEVLKLIAEYKQHEVLIAVDLKASDAATEVVQLAEKHGVLHRLLFIGKTIVEPQVREQLAIASRHSHAAAVANHSGEFADALSARHADWVYFRYLPPAEQMAAVRQANKQAFIAGVTVAGHLPDNWQQAAKVGISAILTDFPLELADQLRKPTQIAASTNHSPD